MHDAHKAQARVRQTFHTVKDTRTAKQHSAKHNDKKSNENKITILSLKIVIKTISASRKKHKTKLTHT